MRSQTQSFLDRRAVIFTEALRPARARHDQSNGHHAPTPPNGSGPAQGSIAFHRAEYERLRVRKMEMELRQKEGRLVEVEAVQRVAAERGRQVRDAILGIPDRIASILAAETDSAVVNQTLAEELRQALDQLCDQRRSSAF